MALRTCCLSFFPVLLEDLVLSARPWQVQGASTKKGQDLANRTQKGAWRKEQLQAPGEGISLDEEPQSVRLQLCLSSDLGALCPHQLSPCCSHRCPSLALVPALHSPHDASTARGDLVPSLSSRPLGYGSFCWKPSMLAPKGNVSCVAEWCPRHSS